MTGRFPSSPQKTVFFFLFNRLCCFFKQMTIFFQHQSSVICCIICVSNYVVFFFIFVTYCFLKIFCFCIFLPQYLFFYLLLFRWLTLPAHEFASSAENGGGGKDFEDVQRFNFTPQLKLCVCFVLRLS